MIQGSDILLAFSHTPQRVVSLAPSITESLFDLGFGDRVVGISDYCCEPAGKLEQIYRVGGPRSLKVDEIVGLHPDLIIANQEENDRLSLEELIPAGIPVWLTFPKTVRAAIDDLFLLAGLFHSDRAVNLVRSLELQYEMLELSRESVTGKRYFCPIWEGRTAGGSDWWMTFNDDTFSADMLRLNGGINTFARRERHYPIVAELGIGKQEPAGDRDRRYPRVTLDEVLRAEPEVILLPNEPFAYSHNDIKRFGTIFSGTPAAINQKILLADGKMIHWPGTRMRFAFAEISSYFISL